jgi:DNA polymerase-3 subunit epsilon
MGRPGAYPDRPGGIRLARGVHPGYAQQVIPSRPLDPLARREAILLARNVLRAQPLYLDTETTGLDASAEVIEISLVESSGRPVYESLVQPRRAIPPEATRIHGLSDADLRSAPSWPDVWQAVEPLLRDRTVATYNAAFDRKMLQQTHASYRLEWSEEAARFFCVMELYARYFGSRRRPGGSFRWHSLEAAGAFLGLALPNRHRATDDALLARAVLERIAEQTP